MVPLRSRIRKSLDEPDKRRVDGREAASGGRAARHILEPRCRAADLGAPSTPPLNLVKYKCPCR